MQNYTVWARVGMSSHKAAAVLLCPHTLPHWISYTAMGAEEECSDTTDHPLSCFITAHSLPTYWWPRPFLVSPMASYLSLCEHIGRDKTVSSWRCRNQGKELLGMCLCARKVGNQGEVHWKLEELSRERNLGKQLLWTPTPAGKAGLGTEPGTSPQRFVFKKIPSAAEHLGWLECMEQAEGRQGQGPQAGSHPHEAAASRALHSACEASSQRFPKPLGHETCRLCRCVWLNCAWAALQPGWGQQAALPPRPDSPHRLS